MWIIPLWNYYNYCHAYVKRECCLHLSCSTSVTLPFWAVNPIFDSTELCVQKAGQPWAGRGRDAGLGSAGADTARRGLCCVGAPVRGAAPWLSGTRCRTGLAWRSQCSGTASSRDSRDASDSRAHEALKIQITFVLPVMRRVGAIVGF